MYSGYGSSGYSGIGTSSSAYGRSTQITAHNKPSLPARTGSSTLKTGGYGQTASTSSGLLGKYGQMKEEQKTMDRQKDTYQPSKYLEQDKIQAAKKGLAAISNLGSSLPVGKSKADITVQLKRPGYKFVPYDKNMMSSALF